MGERVGEEAAKVRIGVGGGSVAGLEIDEAAGADGFFPRDQVAFGAVVPAVIAEHASCDRLRLTADGQLRTCLFATEETDVRDPLRAGASDAELERIVADAVLRKGPGHGMADPEWTYAGRPMSLIGG